MKSLQHEITKEFGRIADDYGAKWAVHDSHIEMSKGGIVLRVRWTIERVAGVFVTLAANNQAQEFGLPYLVAYRTGNHRKLDWPSFNDLDAAIEATKKYASGLLLGTDKDFGEFAAFAADLAQKNVRTFPMIRATRRVRPEWI